MTGEADKVELRLLSKDGGEVCSAHVQRANPPSVILYKNRAFLHQPTLVRRNREGKEAVHIFTEVTILEITDA